LGWPRFVAENGPKAQVFSQSYSERRFPEDLASLPGFLFRFRRLGGGTNLRLFAGKPFESHPLRTDSSGEALFEKPAQPLHVRAQFIVEAIVQRQQFA